MFWTILLYVYLGISVLTVVLCAITINEVKTRYLALYGRPLTRYSTGSWIGAVIRMLIGCFTPLFHLVLFIGYTFLSERVVTGLLQDMEQKFHAGA